MLRYIFGLEERIDRSDYELELARSEHEKQEQDLHDQLKKKDAEIKRLRRELALANDQLSVTSRNSSKPPSSDSLSTPKRLGRVKGKRSRGGQPGHEFHPRQLVDTDTLEPGNVVDHTPACCRACGKQLSGLDAMPARHQILDVPMPAPVVVEHRLHRLTCAHCGLSTQATLPAGVSATGFGPGVEAAVATLWSACRLSHRTIVATMQDLFGVRMALGTVRNILDRVGRHVEVPVDEARRHIRMAEEPKHVDETGWYQRGADGSNATKRRAWLWVAATAAVVTFNVALSRSQSVAKSLLGAVVMGTVVTDRYLGYRFVDIERRQVCWAHLYRDFVRIGERTGECGRIGRELVRKTEKLFRLWSRYRAGRLDESVWEAETAALRFRIRGLLERGASLATRRDEQSPRTRTKNSCAEILTLEPAMWLFLSTPGVGLTNNHAERMLRHAVLWRRASFGSQSARGAELVAAVLTVVMTRRAQGKSVHAYLLEACQAARTGRGAPPLVESKS